MFTSTDSVQPSEQMTHQDFQLDTIESAIADIRAGKVIIVVDDEDRENEGDFICAAQCVTPEIINFMATHGRGLICAPIEEKRADELELPLMVSSNTALHETAFTVSIDLIGQGCTTGISAYDRSTCLRAMVDKNMTARDFARPGHIFPLRAKTGGVLRRTGHTEAAIDLAELAGFQPAGVLVEILNEDGSMARLPDLMKISKKHDLKVISIKDLVAYRMRNERLIEKELTVQLTSKHGTFDVTAYRQITTNDTHLAITMGNWSRSEPVLVRAHSSTETGDELGFLFGKYGDQLDDALARIAEAGKGILLLMRHREKDRELIDQMRVLAKAQDPETPSQEMEQRDYGVGAQILHDLNVAKIILMTNSPKRRIGMIGFGLEIVETVHLNDE